MELSLIISQGDSDVNSDMEIVNLWICTVMQILTLMAVFC
jgi:hypothetical protein